MTLKVIFCCLKPFLAPVPRETYNELFTNIARRAVPLQCSISVLVWVNELSRNSAQYTNHVKRANNFQKCAYLYRLIRIPIGATQKFYIYCRLQADLLFSPQNNSKFSVHLWFITSNYFKFSTYVRIIIQIYANTAEL